LISLNTATPYRASGLVLCGYQDIDGSPGNGRMSLDHGRLVAENINNN